MRKSVRFGLTATVAALAFAAMVANASANHLSISNQQFRVVWTSLIFETNGEAAGRVLCPVTIEGSFHSATIIKTLGALIGYITRASVAGSSCIGGTATILTATLPWHVQYGGFQGSLPRPSGVILDLINASFQIHPTGSLTCLARSEARRPAQGIAELETGGRVTGLKPEQGKTLPLTGEFGLCSLASGIFKEESVGVVTLLGTTNSISVTLI